MRTLRTFGRGVERALDVRVLYLFAGRSPLRALSTNRALLSVITDERDAIQKKTFTKWVNKHLKKVSPVENGAEIIWRVYEWRDGR